MRISEDTEVFGAGQSTLITPLTANARLINRLYSDDHIERENAAYELAKKGEQILPLLEPVFRNNQLLKGESARYSAIYILGEIGEKAFPLLVLSCTDVSQDVVHRASEVLKEKGEAALNYLITCLERGNQSQKSGALTAISRIGKEAKKSIPAILLLLGDREALIRAKSCEALGNIGEEPEIVVPALEKMLDDPDWLVSEDAKEALLKFS